MGLTSLQVCMDASDWLLQQGTMNGDGIDSCSSPTSGGGGGMLSRPASASAAAHMMMERRLRPPQDQSLKCPRCESAHTKFCYYNNYSLSQPRYFCKTCRRYWTKGGTLRNIPVGGGCRKNKKSSSSKKSNSSGGGNNNNNAIMNTTSTSVNNNGIVMGSSTDLQLAAAPFFSTLIGNINQTNFLETKYNAMLDNIQHYSGSTGNSYRPIDFMDQNNKLDAFHHAAASRAHVHHIDQTDHHHHQHHYQMGSSLGAALGGRLDFGMMGENCGIPDHMSASATHHQGDLANFLCSQQQQFGNNSNTLNMMMDNRLMLPYDISNVDVQDHHQHHHHQTEGGVDDMKPKLLTLEWQDHHHHQGTTTNTASLNSASWMNHPYATSQATNSLI